MAHVEPDAAVTGTEQLKYKGVDAYKVDVSIVKMTVAVKPVPEYEAVTCEEMVPYVVLVPIALTIEQFENEHEVSGILKY